MYAITFSNGYSLTGLKVNGSAFETSGAVDRERVLGGLRRVSIVQTGEDEGDALGVIVSGEYENMSLGYYGEHDGVTQLVLNSADPMEQEKLQNRADIDYIAMMTGVTL